MPKLTARTIRKIKPPAAGHGARDMPDMLMPGLYLTVQPSGVSSWCVRYRLGGKQRRYTLGRSTTLNVDKARKRAQAILLQVEAGIDPQIEKAAKRKGEVADAFPVMAERFIENYSIGKRGTAQPKNRSWLTQARLLGLECNWQARRNPEIKRQWRVIPGSPADRWQQRPVASITKRDVSEVVLATTERGPVLANRVHATLSRFFSWLVEQGVLDTSPATGTKPPTPERSRDRVLTLPELSVVWHAAEALGTPFCQFVRLLILTGARRSEVAAMRRDEVDESGVWVLPPARAKNGEAHELPLPKFTRGLLAGLSAAESGYVFSTTGHSPISGFGKMKDHLDAAILAARGKPLEPWVLHDLRRSAATGWASLGIEPHIIEGLLNHKSGIIRGVAKVYNRFPYHEEKREALDRWEAHIVAGVIGG